MLCVCSALVLIINNIMMVMIPQVINAYVSCVKSQEPLQGREDGYAYLETTFAAEMFKSLGTKDLEAAERESFLLDRSKLYAMHDMVIYLRTNLRSCLPLLVSSLLLT